MKILVLRREYDLLVERYPSFMAIVYPKLVRQWCLVGVWISGHEGSGFAEKLASVRDF